MLQQMDKEQAEYDDLHSMELGLMRKGKSCKSKKPKTMCNKFIFISPEGNQVSGYDNQNDKSPSPPNMNQPGTANSGEYNHITGHHLMLRI